MEELQRDYGEKHDTRVAQQNCIQAYCAKVIGGRPNEPGVTG